MVEFGDIFAKLYGGGYRPQNWRYDPKSFLTRLARELGGFGVGSVNATHYGSTRDATTLQLAIDDLEYEGGGILLVEPGTWTLHAPLTVQKPLVIIGAGIGSDSTGVGAAAHYTEFISDDGIATTDAMITFGSATSGNVLTGCGMMGIGFRTQTYRVQEVIKLVAVTNGRFADLKLDQGGGAGMLAGILLQAGVTETEDACSYNIFDGIYIETTGVNCAAIHLDGETGGGSCYQNTFRRTFVSTDATTVAGRGVWLDGNVDNNHFYDLQCFRNNGSVGYGVYATAGTTNHPRHNVFVGMNGHIYEEEECDSNRYILFTSENSSLTLEAPHVVHYEVTSNVDGKRFTTEPHLMSEELWIPASDFISTTGGPSEVSHGSGTKVGAWSLGVAGTPGTDEGVSAFLAPPRKWGNGTITKLTVFYGADNADDGQVWRVIPSVRCAVIGTSLGAADYSTATDITISNAASGEVDTEEITVAIDYNEGEYIAIDFRREASDAADTAANDVRFLGILLTFEADGPNTAGDFDIPDRSS